MNILVVTAALVEDDKLQKGQTEDSWDPRLHETNDNVCLALDRRALIAADRQ